MASSINDTGSSYEQTGGIEKHTEGFKIGIILCLSVAAFVGFLGNGLVVGVILRAKKLKSVMNRFILHLAISDMIVSVLAIPLFLFINFNERMHDDTRSLTVCKFARFFQYLSPEASMTLLITIGWNRHQAVVHPLNMMTYRTANRLILAAWIYALVVVAPSLYLTKLQTVVDNSTNESLTYCATIPATTTSGLIYVMFLGLVGYIIPLASLIVLYGKIYRTVWRRRSGQLGDSRPVEAFIRSRKKVLKMFLTVIFVFLLTWLPLLIYISAIEWTIKSTSSHVDYVRLITYSLGLCNSVCNPFIYALFNAKFRAGCKEMFQVSFKAFQRKRSPGANAAPPRPGVEEPPGAVLSRRGGFHGTKGDGEIKKAPKKKTKEKELKKEKESRRNSNKKEPVGQLIRRFRSLTDVDSVPKDSPETVQLVSFQRTVDSEGIVLHFPGIDSPQTMHSFTSNSEICVKFEDSDNDSVNSDTHKNRDVTAANGKTAQKSKDGYTVLKEDFNSSPFAKKRTRSEGHANDRNKQSFEETRIRSMPTKQ